MPVVVTHGVRTAPRLFKQSREALGLSTSEIQDALCLMDLTTIRKIEKGVIDVHGPTWVALWFLLEDRLVEIDRGEAEGDVELLEDLQEEIEIYMQAITTAAAARRTETTERVTRRRSRRREEMAQG